MVKNNQKSAFTLAEVLITLAIIGVVAALTIPVLIQDTNDQQYTIAAKKAYSTLSGAVQQMNTNNDISFVETSDDSTRAAFSNYLKNIKFNAVDSTTCLYYKSTPTDTMGSLPSVFLADGSKIGFHDDAGSCPNKKDLCSELVVDTNGNKGPNMEGFDVVWFMIFRWDSATLKLIPVGSPDIGWGVGWTCAAGGAAGEYGKSRGCSYNRIFDPEHLP